MALSQTTTVHIHFLSKKNSPKGDTIFYDPAYKLKWDDFRGIPPENHFAGAVTASGFAYNADIQYNSREVVVNLYVYTYFNRNHSWKKPHITNSYHLEHEQKHFDITYIGTLRFIEELRKAAITPDNFSRIPSQIFEKVHDENAALQQQYDRETRHSINKEAQEAWNKKIAEMLRASIQRYAASAN